MGWFDEQIRQRKKNDDEVLSEAFARMAAAVLGKQFVAGEASAQATARDEMGRILQFYHVKPREIPASIRDGEEQLEFLLRPYGIMRRRVKLEGAWDRDAAGAMLGTWKDTGTVVALFPCGLNGYCFTDPATGKRVRVGKKNRDRLAQEAIAFYKPFPLKKLDLKSILLYMAQSVSVTDVVLVALAALAVSLVGLLMPKLNALLFSEVLSSGSAQLLIAMAVFMICLSISSLLLSAVRSLLDGRIQTKLGVSVEAAAMMRVLSLPADFFKKYSAGDLASRTGQISTLCNMLISLVLCTGLTSVFSLIYITQIFAYAPALVAPALVVTAVTVLFSLISSLAQIRISKKSMELAGQESGMTYALITGVQKIRLAGAEKRAFARWGRLYARGAKLRYDPPVFLKINGVISLAISSVGTLVMYRAAVKSQISVADYYAFTAAYGMVSGAFMSLAGAALSIAQIKPILERVKPFFDTEPEIAEDKQVITRLSGGIEMNNVSFRYNENMPPVLDDLSLKIRPGQYVAVVGRTGCGKSTLLRLLLGFEKPQKGAIYYDGRDLSRIDLKSLRRKIGVVMQDGKLFQGDIYSNIVISAPQLTQQEAWEAAEIADIAEDIRRMPMGMHTVISEGSGGISGGQKQRLMIARAIAPKPKILMLDEATSALDNLTQKKVSEALDDLKCTRIVIAHRLSTIRRCDRILVLDGGKIIEDGTYDELIEKKGFFAELVARQQIDM